MSHFFRATQLCKRGLGSRNVVCPSVCPSVCLSHACFVINPKNLPAIFLYHTKGQSFWFSGTKDLGEIPNSNGVTLDGGVKQRWGRLKRRFSTNIWCKIGTSYYRTLIGTRMCSIDWYYFQWPWVTLTTPNHPIFDILYRLSHLRSEWIETSNLVGRLSVYNC